MVLRKHSPIPLVVAKAEATAKQQIWPNTELEAKEKNSASQDMCMQFSSGNMQKAWELYRSNYYDCADGNPSGLFTSVERMGVIF